MANNSDNLNHNDERFDSGKLDSLLVPLVKSDRMVTTELTSNAINIQPKRAKAKRAKEAASCHSNGFGRFAFSISEI